MTPAIRYFAYLLLSLAVLPVLQPVYYQLKAELAQFLLEQSWEQSKTLHESAVKPWPWADTWPVMSLTFIKSSSRKQQASFNSSRTFIVLADASGESLAFGPGLLTSHFTPGENGNMLIAGHRDTHFRILESAAVGDQLNIEDKTGTLWRYVIDTVKIVDQRLEYPETETGDQRVTLVTCYPFDSSVKSPNLRLLVSGVLQPDISSQLAFK